MPDIRFYHLQKQSLSEALPKLAERIIQSGKRAFIRVADKKTAKLIDRALWEYSSESFIPHDVGSTKYPESQELIISDGDDNQNGATILIVVNTAKVENLSDYERILYMFNGLEDDIVKVARDDWKKFQTLGFEMSYWQQGEAGGWQQKA